MAVVIDDRQMAYVECGDKDPNNATTKGWDCLFRPMPHLCTFDTDVVRDLAQRSAVVFGLFLLFCVRLTDVVRDLAHIAGRSWSVPCLREPTGCDGV